MCTSAAAATRCGAVNGGRWSGRSRTSACRRRRSRSRWRCCRSRTSGWMPCLQACTQLLESASRGQLGVCRAALGGKSARCCWCSATQLRSGDCTGRSSRVTGRSDRPQEITAASTLAHSGVARSQVTPEEPVRTPELATAMHATCARGEKRRTALGRAPGARALIARAAGRAGAAAAQGGARRACAHGARIASQQQQGSSADPNPDSRPHS